MKTDTKPAPLLDEALAIRPAAAAAMRSLLLPTPKASDDEWDEPEARFGPLFRMVGSTAVVRVHGGLIRSDQMGCAPWSMAYPRVEAACMALAEKARAGLVTSVVFDINSPGGMVAGCQSAAMAVEALGQVVPTTAYVDGEACSAGYWLAAACKRIVVTPTSSVGCIGAVMTFVSYSEDLVSVDYVVSSQTPYKVPDVEVDEDRARIQRQVDDIAAVFLSELARLRGVAGGAEALAEQYGQGDVFVGAAALARGMVDEVAMLPESLRPITPPLQAGTEARRPTSPAASRTGGPMDDATVPAPAPEPQAASASVIAERDRYQTEASSLRADLLKEREARAAAEASLTEARQALAKAQAEAQDATLRTEANNALVEGRITADEVDAYRKAAARRDAGDADWFNAQFASRKAGAAWPGGAPVAQTHGSEVKAEAKADPSDDVAVGEAVLRYAKTLGTTRQHASSLVSAEANARGVSFSEAALALASA